jgi:hypothetical protein
MLHFLAIITSFSCINADSSSVYDCSLKHGVDMLKSIQSDTKSINKRKSLKVIAAFFRFVEA